MSASTRARASVFIAGAAQLLMRATPHVYTHSSSACCGLEKPCWASLKNSITNDTKLQKNTNDPLIQFGFWMRMVWYHPTTTRSKNIYIYIFDICIYIYFIYIDICIYSYTLQGINISHLGKRKIIFKMPFLGDMLVSWRVFTSCCISIISKVWRFLKFGQKKQKISSFSGKESWLGSTNPT